MVMMRTPLSLEDLQNQLERGEAYPFYAVLLYTPLNGLNVRLHEYVESRWDFLNSLTGDNCLMVALEKRGRPIGRFRPEIVYEIARFLGVAVNQIPCLVLFTEPQQRNETLVLDLTNLLSLTPTEEELTTFFQDLQAVMDSCAEQNQDLYSCLQSGLNREVMRPAQVARAGQWLARSAAAAATVLQILPSISALLGTVTQ